MNVKVIILLFFLIAPTFTSAQSAGFLSDNIWYSKDPFFAGDKVRIYSAIFNSTEWDIVGKVGFYDNQKLIGNSEFFVERNGNLAKTWIDWQVSEGEHKISAKIQEAQVTTPEFENNSLDFLKINTSESVRSAYLDTDSDGIPNKDDSDNDNDRVSDEGEKRLGTDSKKYNTPEEFAKAREEQQKISDSNSVNAVNDLIYLASEELRKKAADKGSGIFEKKIQELEVRREEVKLKSKKQDNLELLRLILGGIFAKNDEEEIKSPEFVKDLPIFNRVYSAVLGIAIWSLKNRIIFYILGLLVVYKIIRVILFKRKWSRL